MSQSIRTFASHLRLPLGKLGMILAWIWMTSLPFNLGKAQETFLVSSISEYRLPTSEPRSRQALSATQIAQLAESNKSKASLLTADANARKRSGKALHNESESEKIFDQIQAAAAFRMQQTLSANAVKLHFAIAACLEANRLFDESQLILDNQRVVQAKLIQEGIAIPDDLLVERLATLLEDKRIENQAKIAGARALLAGIIGHEYACSHAPYEEMNIKPSDGDVCERINQAMRCRCDLVTMQHLRATISKDTLQAWNNVGAFMSGSPPALSACTLFHPLFKAISDRFHRDEIDSAVAARRKWMDDLIAETRKHISVEVEMAFDKKKYAALRWVNAVEQVKQWDTRIEQLKKLSEAHGNLPEQFQAETNRIQSKGQLIERWLEWHNAELELVLAMGCGTYQE